MKALVVETKDLRSIHSTHLVERRQIITTCPLISKGAMVYTPHLLTHKMDKLKCNLKKFKRHSLSLHIKNSSVVHQEHTYMATKSQATDSKIRNRENKMAAKRLSHL